jgi:hypothetical protein
MTFIRAVEHEVVSRKWSVVSGVLGNTADCGIFDFCSKRLFDRFDRQLPLPTLRNPYCVASVTLAFWAFFAKKRLLSQNRCANYRVLCRLVGIS